MWCLACTAVQFNNLVRRFLLDYCAAEAIESSTQVLAEFRGPRYRIRINPLVCPITKDENTGRRVLNVKRCTPAQLIVTTEPYIIRGPHSGTVSYVGEECRCGWQPGCAPLELCCVVLFAPQCVNNVRYA
jgi:hypothetical protein